MSFTRDPNAQTAVAESILHWKRNFCTAFPQTQIHDGVENGFLVDPAFIVAGERKSEPEPPKGGGGGCNSLGFAPALLILLSPLSLLTRRK